MVLWYPALDKEMKTTIDIPDELFRAAKAKAALEGRKLKDLVVEGLQQVVAAPPKGGRLRKAKFPLVRSRRADEKITVEAVNQAIAAMDDEIERYYAQFMRR